MTLSKVHSTLSTELENLAERVIGMCLRVHTELGPGMNETVCVRACQVELEESGVSYDSERSVPIRYRGRLIYTQRIDLLIEDQLIIEAKSVERIHPVHVAQAVSYLRATGLRLALVINFNVESLRLQGIRRVVL
jgi:GxxExxY protein